ncbi:MAG: desulfoferrodoxin Dfx [Butyrivibrio sp.]|uniref:desulfoferrodoxin family protein n=1 Tax=Butyrivibrio sp. NC2002 TaxID=1410610 RepID=UPI00056016F5|nr:desulfoferrodoxin family protein [Butyrivibrio sp. NC2002]MBE5861116.1 desulfoferrodoxin Dfx [Butyrivibrio sp.]
MKFYKCEKCGSFVIKINDAACNPVCCGAPMTELVPGATDGAHEKHVPVVTVDGNKITVQVGEVEHPMMDAHYIQYIWLETDKGFMQKDLKPGDKPVAEFVLADGEKAKAAYEFCNLHGLWVKEI